jgi:hypothetical protein
MGFYSFFVPNVFPFNLEKFPFSQGGDVNILSCMDSKPTPGSGFEVAPTDPSAGKSPEELESLRKKILASIAPHLTLSLFEPGKENLLRLEIDHHLQEKLQTEKVELSSEITDKWVEDVIAGLSPDRLPSPNTGETLQTTTWTLDSLRAHVAPYIAAHLGNALFEPGREAQLSEAVFMLVQEKIRQDEIPVDDTLRNNLMKALSEAMDIPLPSTLNKTQVPPTKTTLPPPPPNLESPSGTGTKPESKSETRPLAQGDTPLQSLTSDLRRQILLEIASKLDSGILGAGKPAAAHTHVEFLLAAAIQKIRVELTPEQRDEILGTILSGEGVEFQL